MFKKDIIIVDKPLDFETSLISKNEISSTSIIQISPRFCSNGYFPLTKFQAQKNLSFTEYNSFYSPKSVTLSFYYSFLRELKIPKEISRILPCYVTEDENYIGSGGGRFSIPNDKEIFFWIKYVFGQPDPNIEWTELKTFEEATTRIEYGESIPSPSPVSFSGPNNTSIFYSVNIPFLKVMSSSKNGFFTEYYDIGDIRYLSSDFLEGDSELPFDLSLLSSYYD